MEKNKGVLGILFLAIFLNLTGFTIILPLSPALLEFYLPLQESSETLLSQFVQTISSFATTLGNEDPSFTTAVVFGCMLASLYAFLQFIFAPIWGKLSDLIGRRRILLITLAGTSISYILWIFSGTFETFIFSRIAAGIMAGNLAVATAAIADVTSRENRTKGMALVGVAFSLGFIIGPALGGLLTLIDLRTVFPGSEALGMNPFSMPALVATVFAVINFFWVLFRFPETLTEEKRNEKGHQLSMLKSITHQSRPMFNTNASYFIFILAFSGLEFTLAFLAAERFDYEPVQLGCLFLYIGFILILSQGYFVRKLANRIEERYIAAVGILAGMVSFATIAYAFEQTQFNLWGFEFKICIQFIVGSTFLAFAIGFVSPSLSSLVSLFASEKAQGQYLGLFRAAGSLARACGPMLAAIPYFYFGSKIAYVSATGLLVIPLLLILATPTPDKIDKAKPTPADPLESEEAPTL